MLEPCNWERNNEASKFSLARPFLRTRQFGKNFHRLYVLASVFFLGIYYIVATLLTGWKILMCEISFYSCFFLYISCAARVREARRPIFKISGLQDLETRFSSLGVCFSPSFFSLETSRRYIICGYARSIYVTPKNSSIFCQGNNDVSYPENHICANVSEKSSVKNRTSLSARPRATIGDAGCGWARKYSSPTVVSDYLFTPRQRNPRLHSPHRYRTSLCLFSISSWSNRTSLSYSAFPFVFLSLSSSSSNWGMHSVPATKNPNFIRLERWKTTLNTKKTPMVSVTRRSSQCREGDLSTLRIWRVPSPVFVSSNLLFSKSFRWAWFCYTLLIFLWIYLIQVVWCLLSGFRGGVVFRFIPSLRWGYFVSIFSSYVWVFSFLFWVLVGGFIVIVFAVQGGGAQNHEWGRVGGYGYQGST